MRHFYCHSVVAELSRPFVCTCFTDPCQMFHREALAALHRKRLCLHSGQTWGESNWHPSVALQASNHPGCISDQCRMAGPMLRLLLHRATVLLSSIVDVVAYEMYTREAGRVYTRS